MYGGGRRPEAECGGVGVGKVWSWRVKWGVGLAWLGVWGGWRCDIRLGGACRRRRWRWLRPTGMTYTETVDLDPESLKDVEVPPGQPHPIHNRHLETSETYNIYSFITT